MREFQLFIDLIKSGFDKEIENKFKIEYIEKRDKSLCSPLHHACQYGKLGLVKMLLDNHCKIDSRTKNGHQPIHLACENGHIDIVEILIANKCDINASGEWEYKPIHLACLKGHIDIIKILIANKCDINASDNSGYQPMHLASQNGHIDIVKILIANTCDIIGSDKRGYQPIHWACEKGHIDIVEILIAKKCDINASNKRGDHPIHLACKNDHIDIVKILIANKCDINASNKNGYQPIYLACIKGHIDIVEILIANKCDINTSDNSGYQLIHLACENGHIDIVKILIENKCDINASDEDEYKPIHFACKNGHIDIVKILIDNKCNLKSLTKDGKYPIDVAKQRSHQQIIDMIVSADPVNANSIQSVVREMNLQCTINCDHKFCRETLNQEKLPKGELIGSGSFGEVYKYKTSNTNQEIVIKKTKDIGEDKKNIEININKFSSQIIHRNIVRYFGALEKSGKLCIFMEYISGGSLKDLIDNEEMIEITKVIQYSKQILIGLQFLHSKSIIHRDIKPGNILLDHDETVKLADFGLSKSLKKSFSESINPADTVCGTPNYIAPEIFLDVPYDYSADIWSTGATIIHMITGKMPYHHSKPTAVIFKIGTTKKIEFTPCQPISETMQLFINDLLTPEPSKRPAAGSLLNHSIFKNVR